MDFDEPVEYIASDHVVHQIQRSGQFLSPKEISKIVSEGMILLDYQHHRYIRSGSLRFPCIRMDEKGNRYLIKSVITKGMSMNCATEENRD